MSKNQLMSVLSNIALTTTSTARDLKQYNNQRRCPNVDIYGQPIRCKSSNNKFEFPLSVSPDLGYWNRFQFKLNIYALSTDILRFKIKDIDSNLTIDLGPYMLCQWSNSIHWHTGIYPSANLNASFDILEMADCMYSDPDSRYDDNGHKTTDVRYSTEKQKADLLLKGGLKTFIIESTGAFELDFIEYVKYSHLNR